MKKLIVLLLLCSGLPAAATQYFVSFSTGNDLNSGTSQATPWKTITKVNAGPSGGYLPGDQILFKSGDTWTGIIAITHNSGVSGNPIKYDKYGTGAAPIIDANGLANVFQVAHDYIVIQNLQLRNTTAALVNFGGQVGTEIRNNITKNAGGHVFFGHHKGSILTGTTTIVGNTYTVDAGKPSSLNEIEIWTDNHGTNPPKIIVTDNFLDRSTASGGLGGSCIVVPGAINAVLDRNTCIGGTQGIGVKPYQWPIVGPAGQPVGSHCIAGDLPTSGGSISDNYISLISVALGDGELIELEGCNSSIPQTGFTVDRNILVCHPNNAAGVGSSDAIGTFWATNANIGGNIVMGGCGLANGSTTPRMFALGSATNLNVHNNTLIGNGGAGSTSGNGAVYAAMSMNGSGGITLENNIVKNFPRGLECFSCSSTFEDFNIFDTDVTAVITGAITRGGHSKDNTHPGFVVGTPVVPNDVKLAAGAVAIGAGTPLGLPLNLILGSVATAFPYGVYDQATGVWMAGAFGPGSVAVGKTYTIKGAVMSGATTP